MNGLSVVRATSPVTVEVQHQIEQFYYFEASIFDEWRWSDWLELVAEDIHYWMPPRRNRIRVRSFEGEIRSGTQVAFFDDDIASLRLRVHQLEQLTHWSEAPPSRTRHLVSNVAVAEVRDEDPEVFVVRSNFLCYRNRAENEVDLWAGARVDELRRGGLHGLEIAKRTILIDQNVILSKNLSVLF